MKLQKNRTRNSDSRRHSSRIICLASSCCILVCAFLLSTVCWAWFTDSTAASFEVQTAIYGARVTIVKQGTETIADQQIVNTQGNLWELENGYVYDVTITATGNANTGHCKIILPSGPRNTGNLSSGSQLQFQINLTGSGTTWLQIMVSWGACDPYYYGTPIAAGEVLTVGPVQNPPEPEQTPTEEDPNTTEETEPDPTQAGSQGAEGDDTEQPTEGGTQSADSGNPELPTESDTQPADSGSLEQLPEDGSQTGNTQ